MLRSDNLILYTLAGCCRVSVIAALSEKYSLGSHSELSTLSSWHAKRRFWLYFTGVCVCVCVSVFKLSAFVHCFYVLFYCVLYFLCCLVRINKWNEWKAKRRTYSTTDECFNALLIICASSKTPPGWWCIIKQELGQDDCFVCMLAIHRSRSRLRFALRIRCDFLTFVIQGCSIRWSLLRQSTKCIMRKALGGDANTALWL